MPLQEELLVIKIGGNVIDKEDVLADFLKDFASIKSKKILIHGGGKLATRLSAQLNIETKMVEGRRVTDAETLKLVTMVYAGWINKNIVTILNSHQLDAIGLCGADGNLILSNKRAAGDVDYGFVGDPQKVNDEFLRQLIEHNNVPIIAPVTHDGNGNLLNTNADTIASVLATSLSDYYRVKLVYCFELPGVMRDPEDDSTLIPNIKYEELGQLKADKIISGGMIPKIDNCFNAIKKGVEQVVICKADNLKNLSDNEKFVGTLLS